jgi:molybdenum cofactor cytidylyltransferase
VIPFEEIALLLLASGLSRRFGQGNKLLAPIGGKPLVAHAAALAGARPFRARLAVVAAGEAELARLLRGLGLDLVTNPDPAAGREQSLRLGLAAALEAKPAGILVLLGDMPHVGLAHLDALAKAADAGRGALSVGAGVRSPPLLVPGPLARAALARDDAPVRDSLANAVAVAVPEAMIRDYDVPEDFDRVSANGA